MNNGDEGNQITLDDQTGILSFTKPGRTRMVPFSACAWVEVANDVPQKAPEGAKK